MEFGATRLKGVGFLLSALDVGAIIYTNARRDSILRAERVSEGQRVLNFFA